ncbi:hypothetical protein J6590_020875, partial [Homalodisca vitripennis]
VEGKGKSKQIRAANHPFRGSSGWQLRNTRELYFIVAGVPPLPPHTDIPSGL